MTTYYTTTDYIFKQYIITLYWVVLNSANKFFIILLVIKKNLYVYKSLKGLELI